MNPPPLPLPAKQIRVCLGAILLTFTPSLAAPAQPATAPQKNLGELVELPAYVVKGDRVLPPPESWRHVVIPHLELLDDKGNSIHMMQGFEVLSSLSVQNTRGFAQELQLRQLAFALFWPSLGAKQPGESPIILINTDEDPWRDGLDAPLIEWEGMAPPHPTPSAPAATASMQGDPFAFPDNTTDSIFQEPSSDGMSALSGLSQILDTPETAMMEMLPLADGVVDLRFSEGRICIKIRAFQRFLGTNRLGRESEERLAATVNSRFASFKLSQFRPPAPLWLQLGVGWLLESMTVSHSEIALNKNPVTFRRGRESQLAPLKTVLEGRGPSDFDQRLTARVFVQYGLYGDSSRYAARFLKFADLACKGPVNEEMFKQTLGMSYARMDRHLIDFTSSWRAIRTPGVRGKIPSMPDIEITEATQSDVARIKADILLSEGHQDKALDELRIAFWRGERSPRLLAALGDLEAQVGDSKRARRILKALTQLPAAPARGVLAGTRIRFSDVKASLKPGQKLPAAEAHELLTVCATLVRNNPAHEELYALIAEITLLNEMQPDPQLAGFLHTAIERFPDNTIIQNAIATLSQPSQ